MVDAIAAMPTNPLFAVLGYVRRVLPSVTATEVWSISSYH